MPNMSHSPSGTVTPNASTSWTGLARTVCSFPAMCMFVLVAATFRFSARAIAEPDIWWHMRNAAYLLQHHTFPDTDMYSLAAAGSPWMNFEWLSEVPYLLGFRALGLRGLLAVYFTVLVLIYAGVYYRSLRAGANCKNATVTTLLAIFLGVVSTGPRMLLFGWLCMVGLLLVLDHFQSTGKGLWLLPPLFALWINLHGSWIFGVVVVAIIIASGLVEGEWGLVVARRWSPTQPKKLLLALAASLAALFVNPFGYRLVWYPFDLLFHQQGVMKYAEEWQPVDFNGNNGELAMIVILALLAAALFSRRRWKLDEVLLMAFALWAALSHVRFLFFAGLIMMPILAPRLTLFPSYQRELDKPWLNAGIMAAIVGWAIFSFPSAAQLQQQVNEEYPTAALEFMQRQQIDGRIFNHLAWGGYMEWYAPQLKPFIDTRGDIFVYNGALEDFLRATALKRSFEILDKYKIDYAFLPPKDPLAYLLEHSPTWYPIYSDKVAVLFKRTP
ncbi:MAG: hypothetical protein ABSD98_18225 [Candidatus Korobacteraceae bacterium]|jgi:hypothetical protein